MHKEKSIKMNFECFKRHGKFVNETSRWSFRKIHNSVVRRMTSNGMSRCGVGQSVGTCDLHKCIYIASALQAHQSVLAIAIDI